jgi:hypothetical protein
MVISKAEIIAILLNYNLTPGQAMEIAKLIHKTEVNKKHKIRSTKGKWKYKEKIGYTA